MKIDTDDIVAIRSCTNPMMKQLIVHTNKGGFEITIRHDENGDVIKDRR